MSAIVISIRLWGRKRGRRNNEKWYTNIIQQILIWWNKRYYPKIITSIKYYFSHNINVGVETPTYGYLNKGEKGIFQRRYFEHTIIDKKDLNNQINYCNKTVKWRLNRLSDWD